MVAQSTLTKQGNALMNLYVSLWTDKYNSAPKVNRFRDKWAFQDMITDLGNSRAEQVINYYFKTGRVGHPITYLLYNYDKLNLILSEIEKDEIDREQLRKETEKRVRDWEKKIADE